MFLKISQISQENTSVEAWRPEKKLWHRCFPVKFAKVLRTPFFTEQLRWLLLLLWISYIPVKFFLISIDSWWMIYYNLISALFTWFPEPLIKGLILVSVISSANFLSNYFWYGYYILIRSDFMNQRVCDNYFVKCEIAINLTFSCVILKNGQMSFTNKWCLGPRQLKGSNKSHCIKNKVFH